MDQRKILGRVELGPENSEELNESTHEMPRCLLKPLHQADNRKASSYEVDFDTSHNSLTSTIQAFVRPK